MTKFESAEAILAAVGKPLGESQWLTITQERITHFADATDDHQWIHVDPVRAAAGPFGACIAHGYLTLSLMSHFLPQIIQVHGMKMGVNYGTDKVRFPVGGEGRRAHPRRGANSSLRKRPKDGGVQAVIRVTVDIENEAKAPLRRRYHFQILLRMSAL